jgi:hypothetical protein
MTRNERPLYTTQGGGYCRFDGSRFYWVEPPTDRCFSDMQVGDNIPEEWGTSAVNDAGIREMENLR